MWLRLQPLSLVPRCRFISQARRLFYRFQKLSQTNYMEAVFQSQPCVPEQHPRNLIDKLAPIGEMTITKGCQQHKWLPSLGTRHLYKGNNWRFMVRRIVCFYCLLDSYHMHSLQTLFERCFESLRE